MEIFLELKSKDIYLELGILMSQLTIWKDRAVILSFKLNLEKLVLTFAMEGIILYIGWDLGSMVPR